MVYGLWPITRSKRMAVSILCAVFFFSFVGDLCARTTKRYDRQTEVKEDHVIAGKIYFGIKKYDKAIAEWEKALEIDPSDTKVAAQLESAKRLAGIVPKQVFREEMKAPPPIEEAKPAESILPDKKVIEEERQAPPPQKAEKAVPPPVPVKESAEELPTPPQPLSAQPPEKVEKAAQESALPKEEPLPAEFPEKGKQGEPVVVNGDRVEYMSETKQVVGTGNISIVYKDMVLTCDRIVVHLDTRDADAEGNVRITQKDAYFTGERIRYNFDTRKGDIIKGYVNARPFFGKADSLEKLANKDQFNLQRGYVTTCDFDNPHYRIQSREVKIYLDDKIVAKHILVFVGNVPVFYLPYYVQPLKDTKTHITIIPGESKEWGYYALTAYRFYIDDNHKGDILLDYRSKHGLGEGINYYYDTKSWGDGAFKFYYTHENDKLAFKPSGEVMTRYRYQARHRWDMGQGLDTLATLEFNKLSDQYMIRDYFYNEYEELGDNPDNYLSFITSKRDYTTQFLVRKRFDKFLTVVERLPEYKIDILNYRIGDTPIYYSAQASGVYLNKKFAAVVPSQKDVSTVRLDAYNQLAYSAKLFRALSVTPYGGIRETYYSRNKWGDTNEVRTLFKAGVDTSIKFYKIYDVETNFLGLDINKLRHIITPTANYYFTHQPTISPDNLNQFDEIDALDTANGVQLAIENRLQTKRLSGDQMSSVDLATLIISTDYMFRLEKNNWNLKSNKFNNIDFQLELIPYSWAYLVAKMTVDTKRYLVQSESIDLVANGGDKWSLAIGHRLEDVQTGRNQLATIDATYKINDKWKVRAYERFNLGKKSFEEQEYTFFRDLHCWIAEITFNLKEPNNQTIWFVMRLKAFPEYQVGLRRTYSRPRFGATGE